MASFFPIARFVRAYHSSKLGHAEQADRLLSQMLQAVRMFLLFCRLNRAGFAALDAARSQCVSLVQ
jgi:hypothetical protein